MGLLSLWSIAIEARIRESSVRDEQQDKKEKRMNNKPSDNEPDMLEEYDFSKGARKIR